MNSLVKLGDKLINSGIRNEIPCINCALIVGQKGTGKSTFFVPVARYFKSIGYKVFCNFPMKNCYAIPVIDTYDKKSGTYIPLINKEWLFKTDLKKCCILIDEAAGLWGSRDYSTSWSARDTKWFTELRKNDTYVFMITQYFDLIDLNCKRSCDEQIFLTRSQWFRNITFCDFSELASLPVRDKFEVVDIKGAKGFVHETWEICARHKRICRMYRKPFYNDFNTNFSFSHYEKLKTENCIYWDELVDFEPVSDFLCRIFDSAYAYINSLSISDVSQEIYQELSVGQE